MQESRKFVEVENQNGEIEKVEIIAELKSKKDDKVYVLLTSDEKIGEYINMAVGHIYKENGKYSLELVENQEELRYVYSLITDSLKEV